jgi:hypothetical protein
MIDVKIGAALTISGLATGVLTIDRLDGIIYSAVRRSSQQIALTTDAYAFPVRVQAEP